MAVIDIDTYRQLEMHVKNSESKTIDDVLYIEDNQGRVIWRKQYFVQFLDYNNMPLEVDVDYGNKTYQYVYHGKSAIVPKNVPSYTKDGKDYIFNGWDKTTDVITSSDIDSRTRLFVQIHALYYAIETFKITLDPNSGQLGSTQTTIDVTYGNPYPSITMPIKPACEFVGWSLTKYEIDKYDINDMIDLSQNCQLRYPTTFYAVWKLAIHEESEET